MWTVAIVVLLLSFYLLPLSAFIDWWLTGELDLLGFPPLLVYWFWFGLVFSFLTATWVLAADLVKVTSTFFPFSETVSVWHNRCILVLVPLLLVYTGIKMYNDTTHIGVDRQVLEMENLPELLEGFRIVHISDIQGDEFTGPEKIACYIEEVNRQEGDLIIFTGDLISYGTRFIDSSAREFGRAEARYGTIAVVGDHDYWAGLEHVEPALRNVGIPLLQNGNRTIRIDSAASLLVTGVTEIYSRRSNPEEVDSLMRVSGNIPVKILASHQITPRMIEGAKEHGYHLVLAGHTHGGQVRVPFLGMSFSASERETEYVSGAYRNSNLLINVNNGLGFTLAPVRYDARPNISVIELKGKSGDG